MVKKNKSEKHEYLKADMQTIKKRDVRKLQETFDQFFGDNTSEMRKHSSRLKNKIYFFGFAATIVFTAVFFLIRNVKFVGM